MEEVGKNSNWKMLERVAMEEIGSFSRNNQQGEQTDKTNGTDKMGHHFFRGISIIHEKRNSK